jgi:hypothetical protein
MFVVPAFLLRPLRRWAVRVMASRPCDIRITNLDGSDHNLRWYIWGRKAEKSQEYSHNAEVPYYLYLHALVSDDEREPHDHPRHNISLVLGALLREEARIEGSGYWEHIKGAYRWRKAGRVIFRKAATPHRIEIPKDQAIVSLFFGGPKVREWGFHCPNGWRDWETYHGKDADGNSRRCD